MRNPFRGVLALLALTGVACAGDEAGMITTDSGLQYEVLRQGDGPSPTIDDQVVVHYRGTLTDGTQFDASYDRGEPNTFPVNGLIAGFSEALQMMSVGSHVRVTIPSELAYGEAGRGRADRPQRDADLRDRTAGDRREIAV